MPFPGVAKEPSFPWRYLFRPTESEIFSDICIHFGCENVPAKNRKFCNTCKTRRQRIRRPHNYYFNQLRLSAKRRGISFHLTLGEFIAFCDSTQYLQLVGVVTGGMTIDRVDPTQGYHIDNIQPLTVSENTAKGNRERTQNETSEFFDE